MRTFLLITLIIMTVLSYAAISGNIAIHSGKVNSIDITAMFKEAPEYSGEVDRIADHFNRDLELRTSNLLGLLALVVLVKAASAALPTTNELEFRKTLPLDAVAYLKTESPPGRLFNSYNWGAYLLWELPAYPVCIDGRTDLYNDEIISQWLQVVRAESGWQAVLDRWQARLILLEPTMPVVGHLEQAGWRLLYQDERSVIYAR